MSVPRRVVPLAVLLVAIIAVAVVATVARGTDGLAFEVGEGELSQPRTAEGLLDGRGTPWTSVDRTELEGGTPLVVLRGEGSVSFRYVVLRLRKDAPAQRIRQLDSAQILDDVRDPAVTWSGWVMHQRPRDALSAGQTANAVLGRWQRADGDGVLVRPGENVRLRTRFDVSGRKGSPCSRTIFEDGPTWEVREDGSEDDWERLRYRDRDPDVDRDARTGMDGRLMFRSGTVCSGDRSALVSYIDYDDLPD